MQAILDRDKEDTRQQYEKLLPLFMRLLDVHENSAERWDVWEDIITLRASFLLDRVFTGLRLDFDQALDLLRNYNEFTSERQRQERDILVAAIDNLVDFAVAEQADIESELPEVLDDANFELYEDSFRRHNLEWAAVENQDVLYAAGIAYWWLGRSSETLITFMTQGDERVRPWHESLEGTTYRKSEFPPELIPPIEWGCRCFLLADDMSRVTGSLSKSDPLMAVDPVFAESLATCGRIFSPAHSYFRKPFLPRLKKISQKLKSKFYFDGKNNS